jgi:hypothetical protein
MSGVTDHPAEIFRGIEVPARRECARGSCKKLPNANVRARLEAFAGQFCACLGACNGIRFAMGLVIGSKRKASLAACLNMPDHVCLSV